MTEAAINTFRRQMSSPEEENIYTERLSLDKSASIPGAGRFRINFLQTDGRPALVARPILSGNKLSLDELMLPELVAEFASAPRGLVLISGSAGCGKSTTMAAMLSLINSSRDAHIVTVEDPVEFIHEDDRCFMSQREIGRDCPSFRSALRDALREAPDVIAIGEMRDFETMHTAISAALTGHLVISSVHSPDCILTAERIVNQFPDQMREQAAADFAMCLVGIIAQRLIPSEDRMRMIPANEFLKATPRVKTLIAARDFRGLEDCMKRGREEGMKTFNRSISELFKAKLVTKDEGARASSNADEFLLLASGMESGVDSFRDDFGEEDELAKDRLNMRRLLYSAVANGASDLILSAGERPCVRLHGDVIQLDAEQLSPSDTKRLLFSILTSHQRELFESERELDFALSLELRKNGKDIGQRRFRINAFFQRAVSRSPYVWFRTSSRIRPPLAYLPQ